MTTVELIIAAVSGLLGLAATACVIRGRDRLAGILGGIGLFLCNVVWILRLK